MQGREANPGERPNRRTGGFLARLRADKRGNTLALMAMSLIPIAGMIGSGLDVSRGYMTKAKLQNACDAAALATRRFMAGNAFNAAAKAEGEKFFNFNFPEGTMGTDEVDLEIAQDTNDANRVVITAEAAVPTTIMHMFGNEAMELAVTCSADQDFVHNDVMLVLDVTGSMNCQAGTGTGCSFAATEHATSRLRRLRDSAIALYRALDGAGDDVRTRYGFMPYSMTVNVARDLNAGWIQSPGSYWRYRCDEFSNGVCTDFYNDRYDFVSTNPFLNNVPNSYWNNANWRTNPAQGCVEERRSADQFGSSTHRISGTVAQADIDTVSTTDARQKWQPYDVDSDQRGRPMDGLNRTTYRILERFCTAPASRLREYDTEALFQAQVNASLSRVGGVTNHDLGIVWGARYLSPTGMFAGTGPNDNAEKWSEGSAPEMRVDRHIIFLTDGAMTAYNEPYTSFGIEGVDARMTGTGTLVEKHQRRFLDACNRARQMGESGTTIWVIALDTGSSSTVQGCASSPDHFYQTTGNDGGLNTVFDLIGKGIGKLRITD